VLGLDSSFSMSASLEKEEDPWVYDMRDPLGSETNYFKSQS
jgi:hypothetical protein